MNRRAFTLLEVTVVSALAAFLAVMTGLALLQAGRVFSKTSGRDAAARVLAQSRRALESDLVQVSGRPGAMTIVNCPASLGGGSDGQAINFLTAVNVSNGEMAVLEDGSGSPYFFGNLFYYVTVPANHDVLYGISCTGGNEGGFDYQCPHKVLIRGREDQNPSYNPSAPATQDVLLPGLNSLLVRPTGFPKTANRDAVGVNLLTFQVQRQGRELLVDLRAVALQDARRKLALGQVSLSSGAYTLQHRFSVFFKN